MIARLFQRADRLGQVGRIALVLCGLLAGYAGSTLPAAAARSPDVRRFWVQYTSGWQNIRTVGITSRAHVTVFAPPNAVSVREARIVADTFEHRIYPTNTHAFGLPRQLGKTALLLAPLDGMTLGYFNEVDLQPVGADALHSNHGNVIYVRLPRSMPDNDRLADVNEVAAHEFQHLLEFRIREMDRLLPRQEDWLNEGLSFYAQLANHFFTPRDKLKIQAAAREPDWRVTGLAESNRALLRHGRVAYGRAGLFVTYLAARFGTGFIRDLVADPRTGMNAIDALLRQRHSCVGQVFGDWAVASLVNAPGIYGYGPFSSHIHATPRSTLVDLSSSPYDSDSSYSSLSADPWSSRYIRFMTRRSDSGTLHLTVDGPAGHLRVALVLSVRGSLVPDIRWLRLDARSEATLDLRDFSRLYSRASLVASDVAGGTRPDRFRVRASLIDVSYNNGVA